MSRAPDVDRSILGLIRSGFGWLAFPTTAAVLATSYQNTMSFGGDPRLWDSSQWALLLGPLVGFGFLAGSTLDLPDPEGPRRPFALLLGRRALWVAVGPWSGFLVVLVMLHGVSWVLDLLGLGNPLIGVGGHPVLWSIAFGLSGGGWLLLTPAVLLRARRLGRLGRAVGRGLAVALGFVGSLIGAFWAATESLRPYFFDPRIVPALLLGLATLTLSGCAGPETLGDVRRRELYQALLLAWVVGLALVWRWLSRRR